MGSKFWNGGTCEDFSTYVSILYNIFMKMYAVVVFFPYSMRHAWNVAGFRLLGAGSSSVDHLAVER